MPPIVAPGGATLTVPGPGPVTASAPICAFPAAGAAANSTPAAPMIALRTATLRSSGAAIGWAHPFERGSLLVARRIVDFLQGAAHRLDGVEQAAEPPLDRLDPRRDRQRGLARTRCLDGIGRARRGVAQVLEAPTLGIGRLHVLLDVLDRQLRNRIATLAADSRDDPCLSLAAAARPCFTARRKPHGVEPGFLLIAERIVELHQRRAHRAHGVEHRIEPLLGGVEPAERAGRRLARTRGLQLVGGVGGGVLERLEARALGLGRLHLLLDPVEREMHQARGFPAPQLCELVGTLAAPPDASRIVARDLVPAPVAAVRAVAALIAAVAAAASVAAVGVGPVDSA